MLAKHLAAHNSARRAILALISAGLAVPGLAHQKSGKRLPQVGFLVLNLPLDEYKTSARSGWAIIKPELRRLGWIEGQNIVYHLRSAEGDWTRLPTLIRELLSIPVDILVTYGLAIDEALRQTKAVSIVGPVTWLRNTKAPSNLTGINDIPSERIYPKHLSLLKAIAPSINRVAVVHDARYSEFGNAVVTHDAAAAAALGISLMPVALHSWRRPESELDAAGDSGAQALLVTSTPGTQFVENQLPVHAWARRRRVPAIYENPSAARTGGLMALGVKESELHRRLPYFVDRLLRGAKPSELPIEDPTDFELVINLEAAAAIGLTVPVSLRLQATSLIS